MACTLLTLAFWNVFYHTSGLSRLRSNVTKQLELYFDEYIDIQCSVYVLNTNSSEDYLWTGNYAFEDYHKDRLTTPIKTKWRNIGRIKLTCKVSNIISVVKIIFRVNVTPLSITPQKENRGISFRMFLLLIAGSASATSMVTFILLLIHKVKQSERKLKPQILALHRIATRKRLERVSNFIVQSQNTDYDVVRNRKSVVSQHSRDAQLQLEDDFEMLDEPLVVIENNSTSSI